MDRRGRAGSLDPRALGRRLQYRAPSLLARLRHTGCVRRRTRKATGGVNPARCFTCAHARQQRLVSGCRWMKDGGQVTRPPARTRTGGFSTRAGGRRVSVGCRRRCSDRCLVQPDLLPAFGKRRSDWRERGAPDQRPRYGRPQRVVIAACPSIAAAALQLISRGPSQCQRSFTF